MASADAHEACPLCASEDTAFFCRDEVRSYHRCEACGLTFVLAAQIPAPADEKKRYDLHRNSPEDEGYRSFLNRVCVPLLERLEPGSRGLDFGCGPGPTLSVMLEEAGHAVSLYDPYYAPDEGVLTGAYEFITATEVFEHLRRPGHEIERLWSLLRAGGVLGVMTLLVPDDVDFPRWRYRDDATHIRFYARRTFEWLGRALPARVEVIDADVVMLHKPA